jgi:outer membrane protein assembly factor BamB
VYKTPRVGNYNLTVAKAKRGGLVGEYFNNRWMYGEAVMIRTDPMINFMWGAEHAITESGKDYISVRWTGYVLPTFSEVYDFSITVNDGVRLWVDDYLIIDQYENEVDDSDGSIVFTASTASTLFANQLSSIKVEFRENTGIATAILSWSSASQPIEIVPGYRLFSDLEEIYGSPFMISPTARKPTLVQDVKLSINAWDEILVEFVPPIDDGGSDITSYTVECFSARPELKPTQTQSLTLCLRGYGTPLVAGQRVYQHARQGEEEVVWCFDLASGKRIWRKSYKNPFKIGGEVETPQLGWFPFSHFPR